MWDNLYKTNHMTKPNVNVEKDNMRLQSGKPDFLKDSKLKVYF